MKKKKKVYILTAAEARKKAARSILNFAGVHLPVNPPDADESPDPTEFDELPLGAETAETANTEIESDERVDSRELFFFCPFYTLELPRPVKPVFRSRNDALHDLFSSAPTSRGGRQSAELNVSGRMNL